MQIPGGGRRKEREQRDLGQKVKSSRRDLNAIRDRKRGKCEQMRDAKGRRVGERKKRKRREEASGRRFEEGLW